MKRFPQSVRLSRPVRSSLRSAMLAASVALLASACNKKDETPAVGLPGAVDEADSFAPATPEATAAHKQAEAKALLTCGPVTAAGFCGVAFGMTADAAKAVYPGPLEKLAGDGAPSDPAACFEMFGNQPIDGVSFLVEQGKVGRVDFLSDGPKTTEGFGVGSAGADIRARFGAAARDQPNKYEADVSDLVVEPPAGPGAGPGQAPGQAAGKFIFEIQDGKVRAWRAGIAPTVDYVERCG